MDDAGPRTTFYRLYGSKTHTKIGLDGARDTFYRLYGSKTLEGIRPGGHGKSFYRLYGSKTLRKYSTNRIRIDLFTAYTEAKPVSVVDLDETQENFLPLIRK